MKIGDVVKYKKEYTDEIGSRYIIIDIYDNNKVKIQYVGNMNINPTFITTINEIEKPDYSFNRDIYNKMKEYLKWK